MPADEGGKDGGKDGGLAAVDTEPDGAGADMIGTGTALVVAVPDNTIRFCCVWFSTVPSCAAMEANGCTKFATVAPAEGPAATPVWGAADVNTVLEKTLVGANDLAAAV